MGLLDDKIGLVTGAGSGIGRATALTFAREGAAVTVADVDEAAGAETVRLVESAGGRALFVRADVSVESDVEAMVRATVDAFGGLHCASNNAARGAGIRHSASPSPESGSASSTRSRPCWPPVAAPS
jgi:NAD(P)-dependent dehydrogenase (short-subunit alcohol dehydrogenase family)